MTTSLRPQEQRLADAIAAYASEYRLPVRVSFGRLVADHGAPAPARYAGLLWAMSYTDISADLAARGVIVRRDPDGWLSLASAAGTGAS